MLRCVFAWQVWHCCFLRARINIMLMPTTNDSISVWWMEARKRMPKENRKGFDSVIMLFCWHLWKHRNEMVFGPRREVSTVANFTSQIFDEMRTWVRAGCSGVNVFCE